jgi:hypothetical protein
VYDPQKKTTTTAPTARVLALTGETPTQGRTGGYCPGAPRGSGEEAATSYCACTCTCDIHRAAIAQQVSSAAPIATAIIITRPPPHRRPARAARMAATCNGEARRTTQRGGVGVLAATPPAGAMRPGWELRAAEVQADWFVRG